MSEKKPLLSEEEREKIRVAQREKARRKLEADARKTEEERIFNEELEALRREAGMKTGTEEDELVTVLIDLPEPDMNSCLLINFQRYWHGFTYTVPRHVARSMFEQMWRLKSYTAREIEGRKLREFYQRPHNTVINGTTGMVSHAPAGTA